MSDLREPTHYRCAKCGETFEIPEAVIETWRERSEHFGQVAFHTVEVPRCPFCDNDDLDDSYDDQDPPDDEGTNPPEGAALSGGSLNDALVDIARAGGGLV